MTPTTPRPQDLLPALERDDATTPRITCYDDLAGPTRGERVELSGRVLARWAAKAGNALQEELDVARGDVVGIVLEPHWRATHWLLGAWRVGACVRVGDGASGPETTVVVTDDPALAAEVVDTGRRAVLVSRAALARTAHPEAAPGVLDEATELPTFGDVLEPWGTPDDGAVALVVDGTPLEVHGAPITTDVEPGARVHLVDPSTAELLVVAGAAWAAGGSVVLSLGTDEDVLEHRAAIERVDARIG